jgi:hypothetical protein
MKTALGKPTARPVLDFGIQNHFRRSEPRVHFGGLSEAKFILSISMSSETEFSGDLLLVVVPPNFMLLARV